MNKIIWTCPKPLSYMLKGFFVPLPSGLAVMCREGM